MSPSEAGRLLRRTEFFHHRGVGVTRRCRFSGASSPAHVAGWQPVDSSGLSSRLCPTSRHGRSQRWAQSPGIRPQTPGTRWLDCAVFPAGGGLRTGGTLSPTLVALRTECVRPDGQPLSGIPSPRAGGFVPGGTVGWPDAQARGDLFTVDGPLGSPAVTALPPRAWNVSPETPLYVAAGLRADEQPAA